MTGQFVGPYRVLRKLGAGGMGEVYLAFDDRLDRHVALKCPSEAWVRGQGTTLRVFREARAAARLSHPNIAGVYDVLELDDRPFIVMEYIEGETLAAVLRRGRLPIEQAVAFGIQLADALAAAHACGIVHRDLKPGNVMVTPGGQIRVLDFGLAKTPDADGPLTTAGRVMGTPGFVAPEVLLGRPATARSDIYAAGAILFQMVTGRLPWEAGRDQTPMAAMADAPRVSAMDPTVPPELCAIVERALEPDPARRVESAEALKASLDRIARSLGEQTTTILDERSRSALRHHVSRRAAIPIAAVLMLGAGIPLWRTWRTDHASAPSPVNAIAVVAVLPLEPMGGDPALKYLGAGMAETMSTKLASVEGLAVVSRGEIADAVKRKLDPPRLLHSLGATWLVTGAVQQAGDRVQVTVNLLTGDGRHIADGEIFQESIDHIFDLQARIAQRLTERILGSLSTNDRAHLAARPTNSVQALSAYYRGRNLLETPGPEHIGDAIAAFKEAIAQDPGYAVGHAGLASAYWRQYVQTHDPAIAHMAVEEAEQARQLDPSEPDVRFALATIYQGSGNPADAIRELQQVTALQPTNENAHRMLGDIYQKQGQHDAAIREYEQALRVRPDYWATYRAIAVAQMDTGRYDEALRAALKITELEPDSPIGYQVVGTVYATEFDLANATRYYEESIRRGGSPATYSTLGTVYYLQGRYADAAQSYERAIAARPNHALTHWNLGDAYRQVHRDVDARRAYADAVRLYDADLTVNPKDAASIAERATCLARLGRMREALADASRATRLAPSDADVLYQAALVETIAGRREPAVGLLERAVPAGYSVQLLRRDVDLASLRGLPRFDALISAAVKERAR